MRTASLWLVATIVTGFAFLFFLAVTAAQLTSEDNGERILARSAAAISGIDQSLPAIEDDLHRLASESGGEGAVRVPGYPIPIDLPREEAASLEGAALRNRILDESASRLYGDGMSAWAGADAAATRNIERASAPGLVDRGLGFVRDTWHTGFVIAAAVLGVMTLAMLVLLVIALPRDARLLVLGGVTVAAALPSLAAAVGLRFAFRTAETDADLFANSMLDIGADAMWIPIRNYLALTLLGVGLLFTGTALLWWEARNLARQGRLADTGP